MAWHSRNHGREPAAPGSDRLERRRASHPRPRQDRSARSDRCKHPRTSSLHGADQRSIQPSRPRRSVCRPERHRRHPTSSSRGQFRSSTRGAFGSHPMARVPSVGVIAFLATSVRTLEADSRNTRSGAHLWGDSPRPLTFRTARSGRAYRGQRDPEATATFAIDRRAAVAAMPASASGH